MINTSLVPKEERLPLCVELPLLKEVEKSLYFAQGDPPFEVEGTAIDSEVVVGFVIKYLLAGFDMPMPIPAVHIAMWELAVSSYPYVAIAAPRDHAKTTAITMSYTLVCVLFRLADHVMLVSDTEGQSSQFLQDIALELEENVGIRKDFGIKDFLRLTLTEIIVRMNDGHQFRIIAKGAEQRIRGIKWNNKRPNLIILDDCESDESVESQDRRTKFRRWFFNALIPAGSARCKVRMVGTVMHFDSLLFRLLKDPNWVGVCFKAHDDAFENILWSERWPRNRLVELRKIFARQNNLAGYSREYLNEPIDESDSYFRKSWIKYYTEIPPNLTYYISSDFAISKKEQADYTVFAVVGVDADNKWYVVDIRRGHWDSKEIIEVMFSLHDIYDPLAFLVEDGMIWLALSSVFNTECMQRLRFPRVIPVGTAGKDKMTRGRALQYRFRAEGVLLNQNSLWHDDLYFELLRFPLGAKDDQVDALSHLGMYLESMMYLQPGDLEDSFMEKGIVQSLFAWDRETVNPVTGY